MSIYFKIKFKYYMWDFKQYHFNAKSSKKSKKKVYDIKVLLVFFVDLSDRRKKSIP